MSESEVAALPGEMGTSVTCSDLLDLQDVIRIHFLPGTFMQGLCRDTSGSHSLGPLWTCGPAGGHVPGPVDRDEAESGSLRLPRSTSLEGCGGQKVWNELRRGRKCSEASRKKPSTPVRGGSTFTEALAFQLGLGMERISAEILGAWEEGRGLVCSPS